MTLTRATIKDVERLLKDGNFTRAATLAITLSDSDPLVTMLARELAAGGNKNRDGRGPRKSDKVKAIDSGKEISGMSAHEMAAAMLYDELTMAGKIVYGKMPSASEADVKEARALLREYNLHKVINWQKLPAQARTVAAKRHEVEEEKIPR